MRGFFHPCQSFLKTIQNNFCLADRRRRGRLACNARSCWRKARFSRISSWREQKALITQPMKWRSDANMADILSDDTRPEQLLQVIHSRTARTFDEGQGGFLASSCVAYEKCETWLRTRAETGQTWQQIYSRPLCRLPREVADFKAGQNCDKRQVMFRSTNSHPIAPAEQSPRC